MTQARRTPRQQRSRALVGFVLEAAAQVFEREGLAATTDRIAARAGVSVGSLYQYFPHKQAVLDRLVAEHVRTAADRIEVEIAALRVEDAAPDEALARLLDLAVDLHADRPALHAVFERFATRTPAGVAAVDRLRQRWIDEVADQLARRDGVAAPDEHHRDVARTVVHAVDAQIHRVPAPADDQRARVRAVAGALIA